MQTANKQLFLKGGLGVLVILLLVFFYLSTDRSPRLDWTESLAFDDKSPYGTYMVYHLLKDKPSVVGFEDIEIPLGAYLTDTLIDSTSYIYFGHDWYYDSKGMESLLDFVDRGNNAYFLTNSTTYGLRSRIQSFYGEAFFLEDSTTTATLINESMTYSQMTYQKAWEAQEYTWYYYDSLNENETTILGELNGKHANFIEIPYGEGSFYFHANPVAMTNLMLQEDNGFKYAESVFANTYDHIIWDHNSDAPYISEGGSNSEHPLKFIMRQEPLRWAWYLLLTIVLIYFFLYAKRRQSSIPVLPSVTNTSIEFVETVGSLYYKQDSNLKMIKHNKNLFLGYVRTHYNISTNETDRAFCKKVALKSGIEERKIDDILSEAKRLEFIHDVSEKDLIEFHKTLNFFYKNCK